MLKLSISFMWNLLIRPGLAPATIFNISSLRRLVFKKNTLSGSLPLDLCHHLPMLEELYLGTSKFTPSSINNCTLLKMMLLLKNNFVVITRRLIYLTEDNLCVIWYFINAKWKVWKNFNVICCKEDTDRQSNYKLENRD